MISGLQAAFVSFFRFHKLSLRILNTPSQAFIGLFPSNGVLIARGMWLQLHLPFASDRDSVMFFLALDGLMVQLRFRPSLLTPLLQK